MLASDFAIPGALSSVFSSASLVAVGPIVLTAVVWGRPEGFHVFGDAVRREGCVGFVVIAA